MRRQQPDRLILRMADERMIDCFGARFAREQLVERQVAQIGERDALVEAGELALEHALVLLAPVGRRRDDEDFLGVRMQRERQIERFPIGVIGDHAGHVASDRWIVEDRTRDRVVDDRRVRKELDAVLQKKAQDHLRLCDDHVHGPACVLAYEVVAQDAGLVFSWKAAVLEIFRVVLERPRRRRPDGSLQGIVEDDAG